MKSKLILCLALVLGGAFCAFGKSDVIPVTTNSLDSIGYVFTVAVNNAGTNISVHITITTKGKFIYADSDAYVAMAIHSQSVKGIRPIKPEIPVKLNKKKRVWIADFTVPRQVLENPDVYFVFSSLTHGVENSKLVIEPSTDFYEINLRSFAK